MSSCIYPLISLMEKTKAELSSSDETVSGDIYIGSGETDAASIAERLDQGPVDFGLLVEPFSSKNITRAEAQRAIDDIRAEAATLPEMTLDEINAEISAARAERKTRK